MKENSFIILGVDSESPRNFSGNIIFFWRSMMILAWISSSMIPRMFNPTVPTIQLFSK